MDEKIHNLILENREKLMITMCKEVISFNEAEIILSAGGATVVIKGENLKVREVSGESGDVVITGEGIDSIVYTKGVKGKKEGVIRRMLK